MKKTDAVWPPLQALMDDARNRHYDPPIWKVKPGSDEAREMGCKCPVLDNEHGRGIPYPRIDGRDPNEFPSFWVNSDCPLHGHIHSNPDIFSRRENGASSENASRVEP